METTSTSSISSNNNLNEGTSITLKQNRMRIENPFNLKVGQVFTGFGVGCGLGIGVGRPLNLGAIPVLSEVMRAASGASVAFSGIARHANTSLKKIGAKNIEAGIGCGVGFGHGFGVGLALKPGVLNQIQLYIMEAMTKMMMKFGAAPGLSIGQGLLPASMQSGISIVQGSSEDPLGSITHFGKKAPSVLSQGQARDRKLNAEIGNSNSEDVALNLSLNTRTEKLVRGFLQDPVLRGEESELHARDDELLSENRVLRMVVKHQQVIEELMEENEKLRQILVEDLKVPPSKLQSSYPRRRSKSPCADCFECRRKQRRK